MVDFTAPSSVRAIDALREGRNRELLLRFAQAVTGSDVEAEDLVHEAVLKLCDPRTGRPWDPAARSFLTHTRTLVKDLARAQRRSGYRKREIPDGGEDGALEAAQHPGSGPEQDAIESEDRAMLARMGGVLRARIAGDALALRVFDLACEGTERAAEAAAAIGSAVEEVYRANVRIGYHASRVAADARAAAARGVPDPRPRATKEEDSRP